MNILKKVKYTSIKKTLNKVKNKAINCARKQLANHPLFIGFVFPFVATILINLGLILHLEPMVRWKPLLSIIEYLSKMNSYELPAEYFVGAMTMFLLFFTLAQLGYSKQYLPVELIWKYILKHKYTYLYISSQFSIVLIIGFFSFYYAQYDNNKCYIHNINFIIIFVLFLSSGYLALRYFYWLSRNISAVGMFNLIKESLDFEELNNIEVESNKNHSAFIEALNDNKLVLNYTLFDYYGIITNEHIPVYTNKIGIIGQVDVLKLDMLLKNQKEIIREIIIDAPVGRKLPLHGPHPGLVYKSSLLRINVKLPTNEDEKIKIDEYRKQLNTNKELRDKIISCFIYDNKEAIYKNNSEAIQDLLNYYMYAVESEPSESDKLMNGFSIFIKNKIGALPIDSKVKYTEKMFVEMIEIVRYKVIYEDINMVKINLALKFIYSMKNVAIEGNNIVLMGQLSSLLIDIYRRTRNVDNTMKYRLSNALLNLKEIAFNGILYGKKYEKKEFVRLYVKLLRPLLYETQNNAVILFYLSISEQIYNKSNNYCAIIENAQQLISLLSEFKYWQPIDHYEFNDYYRYNNEKEKIIKNYAKNLVYISIYIFKCSVEGTLKKDALVSLSFPIGNNCETIIENIDYNQEILNELFYSWDFNEPTTSLFNDIFEFKSIHNSGMYTPEYYKFDQFWVYYSLYRKILGRNFIPSVDNQKTVFSKSMIQTIFNKTYDYTVQDISESIQVNDRKVKTLLCEYREHLLELLK